MASVQPPFIYIIAVLAGLYVQTSGTQGARIGVIVQPDFDSARLATEAERLFASTLPRSSTSNLQPELVWVRSNGDVLSTTADLTQAWSRHRFTSVISSAARCQTALELSAAWQVAAATFNCTLEETAALRNDASTIYWSHIRLDVSPFSLLPYLKLMHRVKSSLTRITAANPEHQSIVKQLALELREDNFNVQWCISNCTQGLKQQEEDIIVYGGRKELSAWVEEKKLILNKWGQVLLVSDSIISLNQIYSSLLERPEVTGFNSNLTNIYGIQPKHTAVPIDDVTMFLNAINVFLEVGVAEGRPAKGMITLSKDRCFTGVTAEAPICLDKYNWNLGQFGLWKLDTSCNNEVPEILSFKHTGVFQLNPTAGRWELSPISCIHEEHSKPVTVSPARSTSRIKMLTTIILVVVCVLLVVGLAAAISIFWCKLKTQKRRSSGRRKSSSNKETWQVDIKDIVPFKDESKTDEQESDVFTDTQKLNAIVGSQVNNSTQFGHYRDQPVSYKVISKNTAIMVTRSSRKELSAMVSFRHENIATFYGLCECENTIHLVSEFCIKGSLQEIFNSKQVHVHLDDMFLASLVSDIIRGMQYLHKSAIGRHGNLKSSNCLVTGRWVVRLSDFGLEVIRGAGRESKDTLWLAPEVLMNSGEIFASREALQKADVYSFGVILYEIVGRRGPFGKGYEYTNQQYQEMGEKIKSGESSPDTSILCCEDYLKNCMLACWQLSARLRPDFNQLSNRLKPFQALLNGHSIVDNMLTMMERYQMRLEDLVEERSKELLAEKQRTESLLHRLLPPSVASQLLAGNVVEPETYDCITVFFSDICGFVDLAASRTPRDVIHLLNDLYTAFDAVITRFDIYKVETVGDAYMCVSGLPTPNGDQHAVEIALMSLEFLSTLRLFNKKRSDNRKNQNLSSSSKPGGFVDIGGPDTGYNNNGSSVGDAEVEGEEYLRIRIGVHSGPCVAGVVGLSMPRYTLFGDTVNVASRLETSAKPMRIHISAKTNNLLDGHGGFNTEARGKVNLKGKGEMETFWLNSADISRSRSNSGLKKRRAQLQSHYSFDCSRSSPTSPNSPYNPSNYLLPVSVPDTKRDLRRTESFKNETRQSLSVLQRAGSFRQMLKSESLSRENISTSISPMNGRKQATVIPRIQITEDEQTELLIPSRIKDTTESLPNHRNPMMCHTNSSRVTSSDDSVHIFVEHS